ncbi:PcfJ domain-containing protein [Anaerovibrio slackiae]|uniref:PcfJ domain-containing protein n=1 Tax=Anaerovibrio slackiae TaxID=2652309 RepID=UPI00386649A3
MNIRTLDIPVEEIEEHFDFSLPREWLDRVDAQCKPGYIWLLKDGKAYCDNCQETFPADMLKKTTHMARVVCPQCSETAKLRKSWVGQNTARRNVLSYHFAKSVADTDVITCMVLFTCYGYKAGDKPWDVEPLRLIDGLYVLIPGKGIAYASPWRIYPACIRCSDGMYSYRNVRSSLSNHYAGMKVRRYFSPRENVYKYSTKPETFIHIFDDVESFYSAAQETPLRYVAPAYKDAYEHLYKCTPYNMPLIRMAERMSRYPEPLEKVAKMGLADMYLRYVYHIQPVGSVGHILNLRGSDIPTIFKGQVTKEDKRYFFEKGASPGEFETWQKLRKAGHPMSMQFVHHVEEKMIYSDRTVILDVIIRFGLNLRKVATYLEKQKKKYKLKAPYPTYADYLKDCMRLSDDYGMGHIYNLADKSILFPQNLHQAHQTTIELIAIETERRRALDAQRREAEIAKQLADMEKKYKKIRPKLEEKYSYQADGYVIIIPPNVEDFTREGLEMHNCVGGYKERVANGSTQVVYIRKLDDMDKSFGTMEISTKETIIQARGKYNKDMPEDAEAFVKKFEHEVLEPLRTIAISLDGVA